MTKEEELRRLREQDHKRQQAEKRRNVPLVQKPLPDIVQDFGGIPPDFPGGGGKSGGGGASGKF